MTDNKEINGSTVVIAGLTGLVLVGGADRDGTTGLLPHHRLVHGGAGLHGHVTGAGGADDLAHFLDRLQWHVVDDLAAVFVVHGACGALSAAGTHQGLLALRLCHYLPLVFPPAGGRLWSPAVSYRKIRFLPSCPLATRSDAPSRLGQAVGVQMRRHGAQMGREDRFQRIAGLQHLGGEVERQAFDGAAADAGPLALGVAAAHAAPRVPRRRVAPALREAMTH